MTIAGLSCGVMVPAASGAEKDVAGPQAFAKSSANAPSAASPPKRPLAEETPRGLNAWINATADNKDAQAASTPSLPLSLGADLRTQTTVAAEQSPIKALERLRNRGFIEMSA